MTFLLKALLSTKVLLFVTLITCGSPSSPLLAKSHFVDNAAVAGGDGSSWAAAWNAFAAIAWSRIQPGDVLYISGGNGFKVYSQKLTVQTSGTSSAPVLITRGMTSGHKGAVILDGQMQIDHGVHIDSRDYITVSGLRIRNFFDRGQIYVGYSTGVVIQRSQVYVTGHGGVFLERNTDTIVRENRITTPKNVTVQTDGLYSQYNTNNIYESNIIIISNEALDEHNDGIQLFRDTGTTIRSNYIEQDAHKVSNAQGIYIEDAHGTIRTYNNIVYGPYTKNALLTLWNRSGGTAQLFAHHNTLLGGGWGVLYVGNSPQSQVKNNILASEKEGAALLRLSGALPSPGNIDANFYYLPHSSAYGWIEGQREYGWSAWRDRGFERNGAIGDPGFVNIPARDFSLTASSPAFDAGIPKGSAAPSFGPMAHRTPPGTTVRMVK